MQIFHEAVALIMSLSSELLIFATAFVLQYLIFGDAFGLWRPRRKRKVIKKVPDDHQEETTKAHRHLKSFSQEAGHASATAVVQAIESMQRLKLDTQKILEDIQAVLLKTSESGTTRYMNEILTPLARSLDVDLVNGLYNYFQQQHVKADSLTFEILVQMHFATRSLHEVKRLADQMTTECKVPSVKTRLYFLKVALHDSTLDEALGYFRTLSIDTVPQHVRHQLVELACKEQRSSDVVAALEAAGETLSVEMLNLLLAECLRVRNDALLAKVERMGVEKNNRTYSLLIRAAGKDMAKVEQLLNEAATGEGVVCMLIAQAVLAACAETQDISLVSKLTSMLKQNEPSQVPAILSILRFYADARYPEKACEMYDRFLVASKGQRAPMDARAKGSLLAAAESIGRQDIVLALQSSSDWQSAMMWNCSKNKDVDGATSLVQGSSKLPARTWNIALDTCVEGDDYAKAKSLMKRMTTEGVADVVSYNTLVKAHLRCQDFDAAFVTLKEMRKDKQTAPNSITYNEVIGALLRQGQAKQRKVWELLSEMKTENLKPSKQIICLLLRELKYKSNNSEVQRVIQLCDEYSSSEVDESFLCSMLEAGMKVGKTGMVQRKLEMLHGSFPVKISAARSFGTLIKAYGFVKDLSGAWRCWKIMRSQHITPTSITIGCMVEAVSSNGDVDGAHELIQSLLGDDATRSQVNAVVYGSVLKGFNRAGRMDRVWEIYEEMKAYRIEPSLMTFNAIIDGCARNGQMEKVPDIVAQMKSYNLQPNLITQSTMIKGLCACGDMNAAFAIFEDINKGPEAADEAAYNTMLEGCLKAALPDQGERLLAKMVLAGISPSSYALTVFVKLLSQAKRLESAFTLSEQASAKFRPRLPNQVQAALLQACVHNRAYEKGAQAYEKFSKQGFVGDMQICQALLRGISQRCSKESFEAFLQAETRRLQRDLATVKPSHAKKHFPKDTH